MFKIFYDLEQRRNYKSRLIFLKVQSLSTTAVIKVNESWVLKEWDEIKMRAFELNISELQKNLPVQGG
jgi:hypothetical protein